MGKFCTLAKMREFEAAAVPGTGLTYYVADNRGGDYDGLDKTLSGSITREAHVIIGAVRRMANDGLVDLVQARGMHSTHYRAIWRQHRLKADERPHLPSVSL